MTVCHSSSDIFFTVRSPITPALLTSTSSPPNAAFTFFIIISIWPDSRTSASARWTVAPAAVSFAARASASFLFCPPGSSKYCSKPTAPARTNASRMAAPMPRELPVTRTVLPVKSYLTIFGCQLSVVSCPLQNTTDNGQNYLFGYGFAQNVSPLRLNFGRTSISQSLSTWHWHDSRISSSWPMIANDDLGWNVKLNFSRSVFLLSPSMPFFTSTAQVPHSPRPRQFRYLSMPE